MKIAFLPYWCKRIALLVLAGSLLLSIDDFYTSFMSGYEAGYNGLSYEEGLAPYREIAATYPEAKKIRLLTSEVLQLLSIALYVLSKDKRDDEYLQAMRAQSFLVAMLTCFIGCVLLHSLNKPTDGLTVLMVQFILYLIIFKIKKTLSSLDGSEDREGATA